MIKRFVFVSVLLICLPELQVFSQNDSTVVSFEYFLELVETNHPLSKQADLLIESGSANLQKAKGNFDPVITSDFDQKQFDGKNYYRLNSNQLKIPTAIGLELKAGYDNNSGAFVNPENQLPPNGLAYAGVAIPIGEGLLFDERRHAVRQAEVFEKATELERQLMINQLLYDASTAYWEWYEAWNTFRILEQALDLAQIRFKAIKESFIQGDVPAIDTLEAFILVQNRQLSSSNARINLQNTRLNASTLLWSEEQEPLMLNENSRPLDHDDLLVENPVDENTVIDIIANLDQSHPKLQMFYNKLENLQIEKKLKTEKVKPKLNLNYNFLNQPINNNPFEGFSSNDYKWGFEFSMPLLLRSARGDLQMTKVKIEQTDLGRKQENQEIRNKILALYLELNNLFDQIAVYQQTVGNYQSLMNGEKRKFEEGESSVFLVNSRESSLISAEVKLIELFSKYKKAQAGLRLATGGLDIV